MIGLLKVFSVAGGVIAIGSISSGALVAITPTVEAYLSKKKEITPEIIPETQQEIATKEENQTESEPIKTELKEPTAEKKPVIKTVDVPAIDANPLQEPSDELKQAASEKVKKQQERTQQINTLTTQVQTLTKEVTQKKTKVTQATQDLTDKQKSFDDSTKQHEETKTQLKTAQTQKTTFESSLEESNKELKRVKDLLTNLGLSEDQMKQVLSGTELTLEDIIRTEK